MSITFRSMNGVKTISAVLMLSSFLVSSCGNVDKSSSEIPPESENKEFKSPNIVRVLNRVQCHESYGNSCTQSDIDLIWRICLENGFTTSMPTSKVATSRELKELVATTLMETRTKPIEQIDENGIVSDSSENEQYQIPVDVKGYCLGSEYILSNN